MVDLNSFMLGVVCITLFVMFSVAIKQILNLHIEDVVDKYLERRLGRKINESNSRLDKAIKILERRR